MLWLIVLFGIICYFFYYHLIQKRKPFPKGPRPWPFVGSIFAIDQTGIFKEFGPIYTIWLGTEPNVVIADYKLIKDYVIKRGEVYAGRNRTFVFDYFTDGNHGIVFSDGSLWKEQRRFSLHVLRDFGLGGNIMEERIYMEAKKMVERIRKCLVCETGTLLDLKHYLELGIGNIINSVVFGYAFEEGDPKFLKMKTLIDNNFQLLSQPRIMLLGAYPFLRFIPLFDNFGYNEMKRQRRVVYDFFEEQIQDRKRNQHLIVRDFDESAEPSDFTSAYWKEMIRRQNSGEEMNSFSHFQLKMTVLDLWVAGLETTITTLKWGFLFMIHHPDVQEKCAQEIQKFLNEVGLKPIKMADRASLPYTTATINEIQRLANLVPIIIPHTVTQDTSLEGHFIGRGTVVLPQISCVMSDPKVFPEPDRFDPGRFMENGGLKKVDELIPFSVGKRACMGESLAKMELFLVFVELIRNYRFSSELGKPLPTLESKPGMTRVPYDYKMLVVQRNYKSES